MTKKSKDFDTGVSVFELKKNLLRCRIKEKLEKIYSASQQRSIKKHVAFLRSSKKGS